MAAFGFWNTYRLGGGSGANKRIIIEGVLAQIFQDQGIDFVVLCEVTSDVALGDAAVGRHLYAATKKGKGQLAYAAFGDDMGAYDLERADIDDFRDVFGTSPIKKGGGKFSKQSKRPVAYAGNYQGTHVYIYHSNASAKSAFLVSWVAESLNQDTGGNFVLAGDLNCEPGDFSTWMDLSTGVNGYTNHFAKRNNGHTHNAKSGLVKTYDWAVAGPGAPGGTAVTKFDFSNVIGAMGFDDDPRSDHLPIVISW
jgi:hypothetical protein